MADFPEHIMQEIEARGLTPKPRWHFLLTRSVFWTLAIVSVIVGAIASAVAIYVFFDNGGIQPSVLLETPLESILQSVPFIWLGILALFTASAYFGLRHTKTGYKYKTAGAVALVVVVSIGGGFLLNAFDFGQVVHHYFLNNTGFYDALIYSRDDSE